jgi:arylsulfatase A-like enzyme
MQRIVPIFVLTILLASCAQKQQPNILFIFTDDHANQAISAYGGGINQTPNLDRLASAGMRFDRCYVTNSICAPSRAVIQTGKHSHLNGVRDNREVFDGTQQTFPKLLREAGYQTAIVGKWHLKSEPTGFDFWEVLPGQGHYYNPDFRTPAGQIRVEGYVTDIITDKALDWLNNKRVQTRPFMLMLQHKAPHREWSPNLSHLTMYDDVEIAEPANLFDDYSGRGTAAKQQEMTIANHMRMPADLKYWDGDTTSQLFKRIYGRMTPEQLRQWHAAYAPKNEAFKKANLQGDDLLRWKYQRYIKDYLRCIASVDDNIGRVLDYLDESGLAENTVVIYSSDQGFYLGEHGWFDKRFMYEESFGTPLIARWPGVIPPGSTNNDLVANLDFAQTFLDIAGVAQPADMQGRSLKPVMQGRTPADWRTTLYYHYYEFPAVHMVNRHEGVFDGRNKLMHFYDLDEWEFYDLEKDPMEMRSRYADPDYADKIATLKLDLERLKAQYQVPPPEPLAR